jgi:hypothetical protein
MMMIDDAVVNNDNDCDYDDDYDHDDDKRDIYYQLVYHLYPYLPIVFTSSLTADQMN